MRKNLTVLLLVVCFSPLSSYAQCNNSIVLQNPSFEGNSGFNLTPPQWTACSGGTNIQNTGPGIYSNMDASEGNTFLELQSLGGNDGGVSQQLSSPLAAGVEYSFTIDLSAMTKPCAECEVWGGFSPCDQETLLWHSGHVYSLNMWGTDTVTFTPNNNFTYLSIYIKRFISCSIKTILDVDNISTIRPVFDVNVQPVHDVNCAGGADGMAVAHVSGGPASAFSYRWNSTPVQTDSVLDNVPAGTYTVTVNLGDSICKTASVVIGEPVALQVTLNATDAITCNGQNTGGTVLSTTTGGTTPFVYAWSNNATTADLANAAPDTYSLTVTDAEGCSATSSAIVNGSEPIEISTTAIDANCLNTNGSAVVNVVAGTGVSYLWSNGGGAISIANLSGGTYYVTATNAEGCYATDSAVIGIDSLDNNFPLSTDKTIMCSGDSAHVCAPAGYAAYQWNNGKNTVCIEAVYAGNYYLTVTDNAGCTASSNHLAIQVYPLPPVAISVNGDTLTSYSAVTYQWYLNNSPIIGATADMLVANETGYYLVAITDTNGCKLSSLPVYVIVTGVENLKSEEWIEVFPNPSVDDWQLTVGGNYVGGVCEVIDENGRIVWREEIRNRRTEIKTELARGVYVMRVYTGNVNTIRKLIKM